MDPNVSIKPCVVHTTEICRSQGSGEDNNYWTKLNKRGPKVTQNRRMQGTSVRLSLRYDGLELSSLMAATLYFLPLHSERKTNKSCNNCKINKNYEEA